MKKIHRYLVGIKGERPVRMPVGAEPLSVVDSHSAPGQLLDMWAVIDPDAPIESRVIHVIGTGDPLPAGAGRYIDSAVIVYPSGGRGVWHVFDGGPALDLQS